jgi:hypothetical protein
MVQIPILAIIFWIVMIVSVLALGIYLIRTNPPKDKSTFIGLGKEKYSNEELARRCEDSEYK